MQDHGIVVNIVHQNDLSNFAIIFIITAQDKKRATGITCNSIVSLVDRDDEDFSS